jgi:hypothetical protein
MEINEQNLEALSSYLRKTLSPNGEERSEGKKLHEFSSKKFSFIS